jgi:integrase
LKLELTAKFVASVDLKPGQSDELLWDTKQPGLILRVRRAADGGVLRTWLAQRKRHGKIIRVRLGKASEIAIDLARKAARETLGKIDLGHDPAAERRAAAAKDQRTMAALVNEYLKDKKTAVRPSTFSEIERYLTGPYFKVLHNVPVSEIDHGRVTSCVKAIARERGAPTAREARQCLSGFFSAAMQDGNAPTNPVIGSWRPNGIEPRDRVLTDAELAAIWQACDGDDDTDRVVRLLILTGCRRSEIGGMAWSELDLDQGTWTLPKERSKNGRAHTLPMLPMMRQTIEGVTQVVGRDHLFGIRHANGFSLWAEGKKALDKKLGDKVKPWRLHDLRRSVATKMADIGVQPHIIEAALNHQSGHKAGVAGIYNRSSYKIEVRNALATWHDHLRTLVAGGKRKVVALPQRA